MFETIAWISLGIAFFCSIVIAVDVVRHPQKMGVMNIVWPVTALYGSVFALWAYFRIGRKKAKDAQQSMSEEEHKSMMKEAERASETLSDRCSRQPLRCRLRPRGCCRRLRRIRLCPHAVGFGPLGQLRDRLHPGLAARHRLPILHHRTHARPLRLGRHLGCNQSRHVLHHRLAARHVRLDAAYLLRDLSAPAPSAQPGRLLVHDAVRHDCRLLHRVSHELHPRENRTERGDGMKAIEIVALSAPEPSALLAQLLEHRAEFLGFLTRGSAIPQLQKTFCKRPTRRRLKKASRFRTPKAWWPGSIAYCGTPL